MDADADAASAAAPCAPLPAALLLASVAPRVVGRFLFLPATPVVLSAAGFARLARMLSPALLPAVAFFLPFPPSPSSSPSSSSWSWLDEPEPAAPLAGLLLLLFAPPLPPLPLLSVELGINEDEVLVFPRPAEPPPLLLRPPCPAAVASSNCSSLSPPGRSGAPALSPLIPAAAALGRALLPPPLPLSLSVPLLLRLASSAAAAAAAAATPDAVLGPPLAAVAVPVVSGRPKAPPAPLKEPEEPAAREGCCCCCCSCICNGICV